MADHELMKRCQYKWPGVLTALGMESVVLTGKQTACPACGGEDRFRFDNKEGRGTYYCNKCGAGNGIDLVMGWKSLQFHEAAKLIEEVVGTVPREEQKKRDGLPMNQVLQRMWNQGGRGRQQPLIDWFESRSIPFAEDPVLRYHPDILWRNGEDMGRSPAMLARVFQDAKPVSIHRTYLGSGVPVKRKMMPPTCKLVRPYIPLGGHPTEGILGIAEGIETAFAARFVCAASIPEAMPVWSVISANFMENFEPPQGVTKLMIFGDNDASYTGQKAAYTLASRLTNRANNPIECMVSIPPARHGENVDWNDYLIGRQ